MSAEVKSIDFDGIREETFQHKQWTVVSRKSHILHSKCIENCAEKENDDKCLFCKFQQELQIPNFPDMTFAKNLLRLQHSSGCGLQFTCLSALKCVENCKDPLKVDVADAWLEARNENQFANRISKPYNWTFSTRYIGDLLVNDNNETFSIENAIERIDVDKLRQKEEILFYDDINLFEDELADNGVAKCSVKIRVMKERFLILLRYFLRVDNVMTRIFDTRFYYEDGKNYLLREQTLREGSLKVVHIPPQALLDPVQLSNYLPLTQLINEKLVFPKT
ncbi:TIP41-like protein isoform X1 [Dinothrombium tinctorium]|uniref:TIP41-like protein n=1 Tax=Dinothrombium tinctorium TaxID=1965070 RepID=A0A443RAL9_9ACAR|nr:TIP41-like protein isoform X1 [Dinothrombium tinctorium]